MGHLTVEVMWLAKCMSNVLGEFDSARRMAQRSVTFPVYRLFVFANLEDR